MAIRVPSRLLKHLPHGRSTIMMAAIAPHTARRSTITIGEPSLRSEHLPHGRSTITTAIALPLTVCRDTVPDGCSCTRSVGAPSQRRGGQLEECGGTRVVSVIIKRSPFGHCHWMFNQESKTSRHCVHARVAGRQSCGSFRRSRRCSRTSGPRSCRAAAAARGRVSCVRRD